MSSSLRNVLPLTATAFALCSVLGAGCGDANSTDDGGDPTGSTDLSATAQRDLAIGLGDMSSGPLSGTVGPKGGTVNRLYFGISGDARGPNCNSSTGYPSNVIGSIYTRLATAGVQFSMDTGDHMFVCQNGTQAMATAQMNLYLAATQKLTGKPTFLTLGNHDCVSMTNPRYCGVGGFTTPNYTAFLSALAPISATPFYSFDVQTDLGLARFVVIADNAWSAAQDQWLNATLGDAQRNAAYIFVLRHHPLDNTDMPDFAHITKVIKSYRYSMIVTGHTHELKLDTFNDGTGRTLLVGNGGAPLATGFTWYGYATVEQLGSGALMVRYFDQATGNLMGSYMLPR